MTRLAKLSCFQHIQWTPTSSDLREFAAAMLIGFGVLGVAAGLRTGQIESPSVWLWGMGAVLASTALTPGLGRATYLAVYIVSGVLGYLISHVMLVLLFYVVFTPIAMAMRVLGVDPLYLRGTLGGGTLWRSAGRDFPAGSYYRQF
jgi:hypothetical protein